MGKPQSQLKTWYLTTQRRVVRADEKLNANEAPAMVCAEGDKQWRKYDGDTRTAKNKKFLANLLTPDSKTDIMFSVRHE